MGLEVLFYIWIVQEGLIILRVFYDFIVFIIFFEKDVLKYSLRFRILLIYLVFKDCLEVFFYCFRKWFGEVFKRFF